MGSLSGHARTAAAHPTSSGSVENEGLLGRDRRRLPLARVPPLLVEALGTGSSSSSGLSLRVLHARRRDAARPQAPRDTALTPPWLVSQHQQHQPPRHSYPPAGRRAAPRSRGQCREGAAAGAVRLRECKGVVLLLVADAQVRPLQPVLRRQEMGTQRRMRSGSTATASCSCCCYSRLQ